MKGFNLSQLAVRERAVTLFLILASPPPARSPSSGLVEPKIRPSSSRPSPSQRFGQAQPRRKCRTSLPSRLEKRLQELSWYDRVETMTRPGLAFMTLSLKGSTPAGRTFQSNSTRLARN